MYRLAIFDFDGTLVDSAPGIVDVMRDVIVEYEFPSDLVAQWQHLIGVPLLRQMEILFPERSSDFHEEVANRYRAIYDTKVIEICPLFPGLKDMLGTLANADILITIASSKRRYLVETVLEYHNLSSYFKMVVGSQEVANHKPHPESVHTTVDSLKVPHDNTVVIGDSIFDLEMAQNAGVDAIGVTTGIHTREHLQKSSPRHIVTGLHEVLPLILNGRGK